MNKRVNASVTIVTLLFCLLAPMSSSLAAPLQTWKPSMFLQSREGPTDPAELEAFMDAYFAEQMEANHVAGAVVSVVKDGQVFFAKGYGYADVASGKLVDPDTTLFRIASVTKLFTWTAVMQLVEQGKLDLDEDVNAYLDFRIPDTYPQPITLKHLMTHTSGLEDLAFDAVVSSAEKPKPLGAWLASHLPGRVRPPGEYTAYSNYGTALAGYIVERAAGIPYDEYIEQYIFTPLEMAHATTRQPLPERLASDMSVGYNHSGGAYQAQALSWLQYAPGGSMSASATDMARFMIAHLQGGRYEDSRILEESTAQQMHSQAFTHDPRLNGMAYGFIEMNQNNLWVIGHAGDNSPFYSHLAILPEEGIGLFVSTNSSGGVRIQETLMKAFLDHYYPNPDETNPVLEPGSPEALQRFAGEYQSTRSAYTTLEKFRSLFGRTFSITVADGELLLNYPLGMLSSLKFYQIEPLVFQEVNGDDLLLFREDERGKITHAFLGSNPTEVLEKPPFYDTLSFNVLILVVSNLLFLSVIIVVPIGALIRRARGIRQTQPRMASLAWRLMIVLALLSILEGGGFSWTFFLNMDSFIQGNVPWLGLLQGIAFLLAALTIGAVYFSALAWKNRYWNIWGRVHFSLTTLVALAQVWFLYNGNVL